MMIFASRRIRWIVACALLSTLLFMSACTTPPKSAVTIVAPTPVTEQDIPTLEFTEDAEGCGEVFVYKSNAETTEYLTVWISGRTFGLSSTEMVFDLSESSENLWVLVDVYEDAIRSLGEFPYCNDTAPMAEPIAKWRAVRGSASVVLSTDPTEYNCSGEPYTATVVLRDLVLTEGTFELTLDDVQFENVTVGWCSG
jgi:hypothetical protein